MNRKLLTTLTIATLLLTACGGGSKGSSESTESKMKKKDFIYIAQNPSQCLLSNFKDNSVEFGTILEIPREINPDTFIVKSVNGLERCEEYDRTHDSRTCEHWDFDEGTGKSCIVAFDFKK